MNSPLANLQLLDRCAGLADDAPAHGGRDEDQDLDLVRRLRRRRVRARCAPLPVLRARAIVR
jgi:hypothetical protein